MISGTATAKLAFLLSRTCNAVAAALAATFT
jgi:hypothetical protein